MCVPGRDQDLRWAQRAIELAALCPPAMGTYSVGAVIAGGNGTESAPDSRPEVTFAIGFPCGGRFTAGTSRQAGGIPGTLDVARIRPAVLSGSRARLWGVLIDNGESPQDRAWSTGALERGEASLGDAPGMEVIAG